MACSRALRWVSSAASLSSFVSTRDLPMMRLISDGLRITECPDGSSWGILVQQIKAYSSDVQYQYSKPYTLNNIVFHWGVPLMCSTCLISLMRSLVMIRIVWGLFCALVGGAEPPLARFLSSHTDWLGKRKEKKDCGNLMESSTCLFIHSLLITDSGLFCDCNLNIIFTPVWLFQKEFHPLGKWGHVSGNGAHEHCYWTVV